MSSSISPTTALHTHNVPISQKCSRHSLKGRVIKASVQTVDEQCSSHVVSSHNVQPAQHNLLHTSLQQPQHGHDAQTERPQQGACACCDRHSAHVLCPRHGPDLAGVDALMALIQDQVCGLIKSSQDALP